MEKTFIKHGSDRKIQIIITDLPDDKTMEVSTLISLSGPAECLYPLPRQS